MNDPDLSRLATLSQLEHVDLNGERYQNAEALLELPALRSLTCSAWSFSDPALIPALRARGIQVHVRG